MCNVLDTAVCVCVFEACVFSSRDCDLCESDGEERREEERGEAQAIFHETFKPILMRNLPLHVSVLQFKKTPRKRCSRPTEGELREREGGSVS